MIRFIKKIFNLLPETSRKGNPDNTRLFSLIEQYIEDNEYESYKQVVYELEGGNSFLLLPADPNLDIQSEGWTISPPGLKIKLGIYLVDGLKAIAAFTSEEALYAWAKKPTKYVSFRSTVVIEMCEKNGVDRIVIDSKLRTMIVIQKNKD